MAGTAISNVAPLGGPVSMTMQFGMLRQWGFPGRSQPSHGADRVWNQPREPVATGRCPSILTAKGGKNAALTAAARIGRRSCWSLSARSLASCARSASPKQTGRFIDRVRNAIRQLRGRELKFGAADSLHRFRHDSIDLLRRRWLALTVTTLTGSDRVRRARCRVLRALGISGVGDHVHRSVRGLGDHHGCCRRSPSRPEARADRGRHVTSIDGVRRRSSANGGSSAAVPNRHLASTYLAWRARGLDLARVTSEPRLTKVRRRSFVSPPVQRICPVPAAQGREQTCSPPQASTASCRHRHTSVGTIWGSEAGPPRSASSN